MSPPPSWCGRPPRPPNRRSDAGRTGASRTHRRPRRRAGTGALVTRGGCRTREPGRRGRGCGHARDHRTLMSASRARGRGGAAHGSKAGCRSAFQVMRHVWEGTSRASALAAPAGQCHAHQAGPARAMLACVRTAQWPADVTRMWAGPRTALFRPPLPVGRRRGAGRDSRDLRHGSREFPFALLARPGGPGRFTAGRRRRWGTARFRHVRRVHQRPGPIGRPGVNAAVVSRA